MDIKSLPDIAKSYAEINNRHDQDIALSQYVKN